MSGGERGLLQRDRELIWHPYTQHGSNPFILGVTSARGAYLELEGGTKVLDAISSWWVNIHGHGEPEIARAIAIQAQTLEHVVFAGFTHEPAVRLAEELVGAALAKAGRRYRVFYSDNGSTAVEVALKAAYQFHVNRGRKRKRFLALRGSYHGDTLGCMSVGEREGFHSQFHDLFFEVDFTAPGDLAGLVERIEESGGEYAAFVFEPMVQGAAGMKILSPSFLRDAERLCRERGILTIADEVFTGFYRTGRLFAFEHAGLSPDLICLSKGITGGFLPLATTLCADEIFEAFAGGDLRTAFLHGHSYTANPIACAAAIASWKLLHEEECQQRIRSISASTSKAVERLSGHPKAGAARSLGTIGAVEIKGERGYFSPLGPRILRWALERGVLLRPLGNTVYACPPYCATEKEVHLIYQTIEEILDLC